MVALCTPRFSALDGVDSDLKPGEMSVYRVLSTTYPMMLLPLALLLVNAQ